MQTAREWLKENKSKYSDKKELLTACANALRISVKTAANAYSRVWPSASAPNEKGDNELNGMALFRELHDPVVQQTKKDERTKAAIEKFIATKLKDRGWYYLTDVPREAGIPTSDWDRHKGAYANLYVEVSIGGGRKITFVHPDCVDEAREIAGRS